MLREGAALPRLSGSSRGPTALRGRPGGSFSWHSASGLGGVSDGPAARKQSCLRRQPAAIGVIQMSPLRWRAVIRVPSQSDRPGCGNRTPKPRVPGAARLRAHDSFALRAFTAASAIAWPRLSGSGGCNRAEHSWQMARLITEQERGRRPSRDTRSRSRAAGRFCSAGANRERLAHCGGRFVAAPGRPTEEMRGLDRAPALSGRATAADRLLAGASQGIGKRPRGCIVGADPSSCQSRASS